MRVHYLQHVPFEGPGSMLPALTAMGHSLSFTPLYAGGKLPAQNEFDALIVMGGPMSVHDEDTLPWLAAEKRFIKATVSAGKRVLGVCLGAQLLAEVLGGIVCRNAHREIGWWPVTKRTDCASSTLAAAFPDEALVFHWHGETFSLPPGARLLCTSSGCRNQGFVWNERVLALQFHLETTPHNARDLISNCVDEIDGTRYVQDAATMLADAGRFADANALMDVLLARWLA